MAGYRGERFSSFYSLRMAGKWEEARGFNGTDEETYTECFIKIEERLGMCLTALFLLLTFLCISSDAQEIFVKPPFSASTP